MTIVEFLYYASAPCIGGVIGAYLGSNLRRRFGPDSFEARTERDRSRAAVHFPTSRRIMPDGAVELEFGPFTLEPPTEEEHRRHQENS